MRKENTDEARSKEVPLPEEVARDTISSFFEAQSRSACVLRDALGSPLFEKWKGIDRVPHINLFYNLEEIFSRIIHDGKNCLGPIKGYASLLKSCTPGADPSCREWVDKLLDNVGSMEGFFESLSIYRVQGAFRVSNVSLAELLQEAADCFRSFNTNRVPVHLSCGVAGKFAMHKELLKRILVHLMRNAYESVSGEGRIAVSVTEQEAGPAMPMVRSVIVKVTDDGCGIDESKMDYVWKPFYTTKPNHFGLGLTYVSMAAAMLRMRVAINSALSGGTTVSLSFSPQGGTS